MTCMKIIDEQGVQYVMSWESAMFLQTMSFSVYQVLQLTPMTPIPQ